MPSYKKMDPTLKAKWLEALRSGKYRQGRERLVRLRNKRYSYCCLGVLCNLDTENVERVPVIDEWYGYSDGRHTEEAFLPRSVAERLGISSEIQSKLANMNDEGKSFAEIADWIEERL